MGNRPLPAHNFDFHAWLTVGESPSERGDFTMHPDYEKLPACLKMVYGAREFAWLPNSARNTLLERECYPDVWEDD